MALFTHFGVETFGHSNLERLSALDNFEICILIANWLMRFVDADVEVLSFGPRRCIDAGILNNFGGTWKILKNLEESFENLAKILEMW